ncbi:hypothetical protein CP978_09025 [Streptomyces nodosus]|uniref:Uncharacterized protein n=1 Tax=Streptomyces nodosus TaxID=40318 RepID=A0A5P2W367_9ACTN|nr:hypothetical protein CP978_09025 [Streptomyces nodosus]
MCVGGALPARRDRECRPKPRTRGARTTAPATRADRNGLGETGHHQPAVRNQKGRHSECDTDPVPVR